MSALIINDVPIECINQAAVQYHVPATLIISVLKTENGRVGEANPNSNGTYDYGPMQVNSIWLDKIYQYGYTQADIQYDPCANVTVGTWILASQIADSGAVWNGVGNYHSHTVYKNINYYNKVETVYDRLNNYLNKKAKSPNEDK